MISLLSIVIMQQQRFKKLGKDLKQKKIFQNANKRLIQELLLCLKGMSDLSDQRNLKTQLAFFMGTLIMYWSRMQTCRR